MKTATARAENVVVIRLATTTRAQAPSQINSNPPATASTDSFFHCRHGRPEHHRCPQCENESQNLPGFFDD